MLFSSIPFLYYFLPMVLVIYYMAPKAWRNLILLLSSLVFYGWGEGRYLFLMLGMIFFGYCFACLIQTARKKQRYQWAGLCLFLSLGLDLAILGYFKYADFFIGNINRGTGLSLPLLNLALPIGISFYTFQLMSYTIDVYRGEVKAQKNPLLPAAYVAMFPQLVAGPIVRYSSVEEQLKDRSLSLSDTAVGIRRFILGLSKKVLLANTLGECCALFRDTKEKDMLFFWLYGVSFMLHIYFDFSGYSDMAIGLGKLLGFSFPENFRYPYTAKSITDFWRRWHISLGSWFRDYVYIPLGGNRVKRGRWLMNLTLVWLLTGFWHGASWNFLFWGLYFAVFLVLEKLWLNAWLKKSAAFARIYVLLTVMVSFLIFDAQTISEATVNIKGLVGLEGKGLVSTESLYYLRSYSITLLVAAFGATPLGGIWIKKIRERKLGDRFIAGIEPLVLGVLLLTVTAFLVDGSFNPFLYFRF
ncbi:MAG: MBOAT family protein [Lachnospiraceae bacterium]|nr:MBOAT family protein [Lachnospiraceae bacterium]MDY4096285.1 MBOAT family O-acyltransferase [Lachnospiraceae bacterium]